MLNFNEIRSLPQQLRLIPVGSKKNPIEKDWVNNWYTPDEFVEKFMNDYRVAAVGVLTGMRLIAVDVDGVEALTLLAVLAGKALPKTIKFTSGKPGRLQALYWVPAELVDKIPNKIVFTVNGQNLEIRYNGHQSVIMGVHPETLSYKWIVGCSPKDTEIADCPQFILDLALGQPIDLFTLINPENQQLILNGVEQGGRDERGCKLAYYLQCQKNYFNSLKINTTDPLILLEQFCRNCSPPLPEKDAQRWLKGAEKKTPTRVEEKPKTQIDDEEEKISLQEEIENLTHKQDYKIYQILPKYLADEFTNLGKTFGQPAVVPALIFLTFAASLLGSETKIMINSGTAPYLQPAILWLAIVGEPGNAKSPLINRIKEPLEKIQAESFARYKEALKRYKEELEFYEQNQKKPSCEREEVEKPTPPHNQIRIFDDFTTEAIASCLEAFPGEGAIVHKDELAGFFNSMNKYRSGDDRQQWISFYDGKRISIIRKSQEDIYIPHTALSVVGGIQPSVLKKIIEKDSEDGFLARFIYLFLPPSKIPTINWNAPPSNLDDLLYNIYKALISLPSKIYGMEIVARQIWDQWHEEIEEGRINAKDPRIQAIYPKAKSQAARLALVIHCVKAVCENIRPNCVNPNIVNPPDLITKETIQAAIDLARYTIIEAKKIFGEFEIGIDHTVSPQIVKFLDRFKDHKGEITTKEVTRRVFCGSQKAEVTRKFMQQLVDLGYCESNRLTGSDFKIRLQKKYDRYDQTPQTQSTKGSESVITKYDSPMTAMTKYVPQPQPSSKSEPIISDVINEDEPLQKVSHNSHDQGTIIDIVAVEVQDKIESDNGHTVIQFL